MAALLPPVLALAILLAYGAALWWLLRREQVRTLFWLVVLAGASLTLRLVLLGDYPAGFNEDEPKILWSTVELLRRGKLLAQDATGVPALLSLLFEAQLAEWIGPTRWAMRSYSLLGSVLSVPAGFAAARSLGLRVSPSLAAAGLFAVLPWSILYGRVHQSGDMIFHELLIANALARFLRDRGGWPEVAMGALGLCFLFYGYFSGRALLGLTLVAAALARGRFRALCLAVAFIGVLGWLPFALWSGSPHRFVGLSAQQTERGMDERPLEVLAAKASHALRALAEPVAWDMWLTVRAGAVHPWPLLALAFAGSLTVGWRRGLFLWAGFLGGMAPAVLGYSLAPSTRRMLMAMPFISLAAACALDRIPRARPRRIGCALFVLVLGVHGVRFYFSSDFWHAGSLAVFDPERARLVEALPWPPHPPILAAKGLSYQLAPRKLFDDGIGRLKVENWFPPDQAETIYAMHWRDGPLQGFYRRLVGSENVRRFGRAFWVRVPAADWSWMRRYGWTYQVRCGDAVATAQVPTLYQYETSLDLPLCPSGAEHVWRGRWLGPDAELILRFGGSARITGPEGEKRGRQAVDFAVFRARSGEELTVRLRVPAGAELEAMLMEVTPVHERVPPLEWVEPLAPEERPASTAAPLPGHTGLGGGGTPG